MSKKKTPFFTITFQDKKTQARTGQIHTTHGSITTPAFIPVGTQATVKSLTPNELKNLGVEAFFVNTYHVFLRPGIEVIKRFSGLHKFMGWNGPIMTDSGGFQVFSLGRGRNYGLVGPNNKRQGTLVKVTCDGATFQSPWDGSVHQFTPERSIEVQRALGADIVLSFDECTTYPISVTQAKISMERTHAWAQRCLARYNDTYQASGDTQTLYGVIQGSVFKELREESAQFITGLPFDGIAIGGVSVGESKEEMRLVLEWVTPLLPVNKPRHLLGIGELDDIFMLVEMGIDTFDCVMPTRLGRMGHILINSKLKSKNSNLKRWTIDITKSEFATDTKPLEEDCACYTCGHFSSAYIHHLFKVRELLGYRLATIHNLSFIQNLLRGIRAAITKGSFLALKEKWLYNVNAK